MKRIVFFADSQTGRKNIPLPIEERGGKWGFIDPPSSGSWRKNFQILIGVQIKLMKG